MQAKEKLSIGREINGAPALRESRQLLAKTERKSGAPLLVDWLCVDLHITALLFGWRIGFYRSNQLLQSRSIIAYGILTKGMFTRYEDLQNQHVKSWWNLLTSLKTCVRSVVTYRYNNLNARRWYRRSWRISKPDIVLFSWEHFCELFWFILKFRPCAASTIYNTKAYPTS